MLAALIIGVPVLIWLGVRCADLLADRVLPTRADIRAVVFRPR